MKMITLILSLFASTNNFALAQPKDELFKPKHGGLVVKKSGLSYEVVRKSKEILVYPPMENAPVPSLLTLKFKNKKGIIDQVQLKLMPMKEPGTNIYSAPVPASIYIAGGLSFDLETNKKEK